MVLLVVVVVVVCLSVYFILVMFERFTVYRSGICPKSVEKHRTFNLESKSPNNKKFWVLFSLTQIQN